MEMPHETPSPRSHVEQSPLRALMAAALTLALVSATVGCKPPAPEDKQRTPVCSAGPVQKGDASASPTATPEGTVADAPQAPAGKSATMATPERAFEALRDAAGAGDAPRILACFTPGGRTELAGAAWLMGTFLR